MNRNLGLKALFHLLLGAAVLSLMLEAAAQTSTPLKAPNVVEITPRLVTSGQPSAEALAGLKGQGFEAVIYLAPPTVMDAVRDEHLIVARQGLTFVNIPVQFDNPTEADFEAFASVLQRLADRKVLVHCQINLRASSMVFLYRTIVFKEDPRHAYESVSKVWSPTGPWRKLIEDQLRKHKIAFELL
jgi:protein tyrosine phosphatase (PTP) superfamily phosphohydrolase (DUF442 family)